MRDHSFNGSLLQLARESRSLSQTVLAKRVGVTQPFVSQLEDGTKQPNSDMLERLSDALDYPARFFLREWERTGLGVGELQYRKRKTVPASVLRRVEALVNLRLIELAALFRLLRATFDVSGSFLCLDPRETGGVEESAIRLRAAWNLPPGPVPNVTRLLERQGAIVMLLDFATDKIDALAVWRGDLPPVFFVSQSSPADRRRLSLAHELAHVVLHMRTGHMPKNMEDEANQFAGAFLMPRADVRSQLRVGPAQKVLTVDHALRLKGQWNTSAAAIIRRALEIGVIDKTRFTQLCKSLSARGYRKSEPQVFAPERPRLLAELIEELRDHSPELADEVFPINPRDYEREYGVQRPGPRLIP